MKKNRVLVFSIAMNGYQILYKDYLETHKEYANKYGYEYIKVEKPSFTNMGNNCCWLKLTLILKALNAGYDTVLFVDSDAKIQKDAPSLSQFQKGTHCVYMAKGYTGRYNSGVILVNNDIRASQWIQKIISYYDKPIPAEDSVGWGENGHIIYHSKGLNFIKTLDTRWNNTYKSNLDDYIRHYSHGPLRRRPALLIIHKVIARTSNHLRTIKNHIISLKKMFFLSDQETNNIKKDEIHLLSERVCKKYPYFCNFRINIV